jgi:hypothetical protein
MPEDSRFWAQRPGGAIVPERKPLGHHGDPTLDANKHIPLSEALEGDSKVLCSVQLSVFWVKTNRHWIPYGSSDYSSICNIQQK